jgi:hypothetical protein
MLVDGTITIELDGGKKIELPIGEARVLMARLKDIFGEPLRYDPAPVIPWQYPETTQWTTTTCKEKN